jgi:hypothetical protein
MASKKTMFTAFCKPDRSINDVLIKTDKYDDDLGIHVDVNSILQPIMLLQLSRSKLLQLLLWQMCSMLC